ncbi:MAG TPA: prepilin-type N-terminal cleavage/methylation domain-containing protein [Thermoanaerobaculia bacterium]|nr:prepilin-type N-terminal cleavage/methylation domain-containing protein [Thermoanaerobaculia bacterium]
MNRERGYSLLEMVVAIAIFGAFLIIITIVTAEMRSNEKRYPINFMTHPEVSSVMARMRKDIFDTTYYPAEFQNYKQTPKTLILYTLKDTGAGTTVVWDFSTSGDVHRKEFNAQQLTSDWPAHGLPDFTIGSYSLSTGQDAVRISAIDDQKRLAIDEIFVPRPHA